MVHDEMRRPGHGRQRPQRLNGWAPQAGPPPSGPTGSHCRCRGSPMAAPKDGLSNQAAGQGRRASDGQALAALGASGIDDSAAAAGLHAHEKPVRACSARLGGLVGALHGFRFRSVRLVPVARASQGNRGLHHEPRPGSTRLALRAARGMDYRRAASLWITRSRGHIRGLHCGRSKRTCPQ